jgi:hypothetical protein
MQKVNQRSCVVAWIGLKSATLGDILVINPTKNSHINRWELVFGDRPEWMWAQQICVCM